MLTEEQIAALGKAKSQKEALGEIETHHPGYLGSQETYFVGTMKGVGRIYQQTFVDTYSRVGQAQLYLTDRGTEYCGKVEHHSYQLYLAIEW